MRAISRSGLNDAESFLLANVVQTYLKLAGDDEERFEVEMQRSSNKEILSMVITWEDALTASKMEGEASILRRLLSRRFADLPEWIDQRLEQASQQELERWADRVLDAKRLEDVFSPA